MSHTPYRQSVALNSGNIDATLAAYSTLNGNDDQVKIFVPGPSSRVALFAYSAFILAWANAGAGTITMSAAIAIDGVVQTGGAWGTNDEPSLTVAAISNLFPVYTGEGVNSSTEYPLKINSTNIGSTSSPASPFWNGVPIPITLTPGLHTLEVFWKLTGVATKSGRVLDRRTAVWFP